MQYIGFVEYLQASRDRAAAQDRGDDHIRTGESSVRPPLRAKPFLPSGPEIGSHWLPWLLTVCLVFVSGQAAQASTGNSTSDRESSSPVAGATAPGAIVPGRSVLGAMGFRSPEGAGALPAAVIDDTARIRMGASPDDGDPGSGLPRQHHGVPPDSLRPQGFFASPTGTMLRSVAFPGWGQWSNGKKQKAAFYFTVESYFITKALIWRHRARGSGIDFATFDHARDRRNYFYWLTGLTVFVSMFDAYADRYLLTLERTRDAGDDYWGGRKDARYRPARPEEWRLALRVRF